MNSLDAVAVPTSGHDSPNGGATGSVASSPNAAGSAAQTILQAVTSLPRIVTLSPAERLALLKARVGAAPQITDMADLAASDSRFAAVKADPQKMLADLAAWNQLQTTLTASKMAQQMLTDSASVTLSDAWQQALAIYGMAQELAKNDAQLLLRISAMANFMSVKKKASGKKHKAGGGASESAPEETGTAQPATAPAATISSPVVTTTTSSQPTSLNAPLISGTRPSRRSDGTKRKEAHRR